MNVLLIRLFNSEKLINFKIFNQFGQLIFLSASENEGWDGNYKDNPQNSGVYTYTYEVHSREKGKVIRGEGNFLLIR